MNNFRTYDFIKALNQYFQNKVRVARIRTGDKQEIETLINEEASLLGMYLRNERKQWIPRITNF